MFNTVLIANLGEIAVRIASTLKKMGIRSFAIFSEIDQNSPHVLAADIAVKLNGKPTESYLDSAQIITIARQVGAQAIIPGYGFLSENAGFAEACQQAGLIFVAPTPDQIRQFGLKHTSRALAAEMNIPVIPGTGLLFTLQEAETEALEIGYPVMLKCTAGGGGIGLTRCNNPTELSKAFESVQRLGEAYFKDTGVFLERFIEKARHIEVQIFGDGKGNVIALGERDCSLQRRNQKVIEETPAPHLPANSRQKIIGAATKLARFVEYQSAGTVEFIYDSERDEFYFLEMNTRLQVEHPVTEQVTDIDLVEWMILLAAGSSLDSLQSVSPHPTPSPARGEGIKNLSSQKALFAIEVRIYAEDPVKNFQPCAGTLTDVYFPDNIRVDTWVQTGTTVSPHYDRLLAKLIVSAPTRTEALQKLKTGLNETRLSGISTNLEYLRQVVSSEFFEEGRVFTHALDQFKFSPNVIEILSPGTYSSIQDYPGRIGYWDIGVPPSGPMDDYAFRIGNRIVGNHPSAAGIECTLTGPDLKFHCDTVIALTGALSNAMLDDIEIPFWKPVEVQAGQRLSISSVTEGCRTYIAVRNGLDVPVYLGSRATLDRGQFGGHAGRVLKTGDMLPVSQAHLAACSTPAPVSEPQSTPRSFIPSYSNHWNIKVLYSPYGAPDFFTEDAIGMFFETDWEVHYNSNRLGIRLNGPKPTWTRSDGGEAGLHPSNIHDTEYAIGSINFTGDMPVILTKDGPSLGGFVCPATVIKAELWKLGQVKPGDKIRFERVSYDDAFSLSLQQEKIIDTFSNGIQQPNNQLEDCQKLSPPKLSDAILATLLPKDPSVPKVVYRAQGDQYILIEYGDNILDLSLRLRVHQLMEAIHAENIPGVSELAPGVRSLQVRYDSHCIHQSTLIEHLLKLESALAPIDQMRLKTRVIHLPLAFEDSATLDAVDRYRRSVRDTAPWLPSNTEFIRRINGLDTIEQVRDTVYQASYMVLGLGDVYLGAPCAVPVDPRHRLVTSKYNPARTFTAEGTVGIGGVYMCIYGMDSPGGYQLVGRTLPIWNKFQKNTVFESGKPWLLRFFDQVRFYPVSEAELHQLRDDFRENRASIWIEEEVFDFSAYQRFLEDNAHDIDTFKAKQKAAFNEEVSFWQQYDETILDPQSADNFDNNDDYETLIEDDHYAVRALMSGNVWKIHAEPGQAVNPDEPLLIVEAMKMEFTQNSGVKGVVDKICCKPGQTINSGELLMLIK